MLPVIWNSSLTKLTTNLGNPPVSAAAAAVVFSLSIPAHEDTCFRGDLWLASNQSLSHFVFPQSGISASCQQKKKSDMAKPGTNGGKIDGDPFQSGRLRNEYFEIVGFFSGIFPYLPSMRTKSIAGIRSQLMRSRSWTGGSNRLACQWVNKKMKTFRLLGVLTLSMTRLVGYS